MLLFDTGAAEGLISTGRDCKARYFVPIFFYEGGGGSISWQIDSPHWVQPADICDFDTIGVKELIWYKRIFSYAETVCPTYGDATAA